MPWFAGYCNAMGKHLIANSIVVGSSKQLVGINNYLPHSTRLLAV